MASTKQIIDQLELENPDSAFIIIKVDLTENGTQVEMSSDMSIENTIKLLESSKVMYTTSEQ